MTPLILHQGDSFAQTCSVLDAAGNPVDLTGYTITSNLSRRDGSLVQALTVTSYPQTGATLGVFGLSATYTQTAAWPSDVLSFSIRTTDPSGVRVTSDIGTIQVSVAA